MLELWQKVSKEFKHLDAKLITKIHRPVLVESPIVLGVNNSSKSFDFCALFLKFLQTLASIFYFFNSENYYFVYV